MVSFQLNLQSDLVRHLPISEAVCVSTDVTVEEAIAQMSAVPTGSVVVCRDGKIVGIFTERDVVKMMDRAEGFDVPITQAMTANPATIREDDSVGHAIRIMSRGGYRRLPIVNADGHVVSILKVSHIMRYLVEHFPQYVYNLPPAPHHMLAEREGA